MVATTLQGLEEVLAREITAIGGNDVSPAKRAVYFTADKDLVYKANLRLRTALRLLKPLKRFRAPDEEALYQGAASVPWSTLFGVEKTFAVKAAVTGPVHTHSHFASLKVKDAIADHFRDKLGRRPSVDTREPDIVVHLRIFNDEVNLSLDSSGQPLNKRGYRPREAEAPLNECLAAGMLLLSDYQGKTHFVDGMCGSGTLAIEAAMIANRIAPGLLRHDYSFMHWADYDPDLFEVIHEATVNRVRESSHRILAMDHDPAAIQLARQAAETAQLDDVIEFRQGDFMEEEPLPAPGFLVLNPPYDERLRTENVEQLYESIGARLKSAYPGYRAWVISGHTEAMKSIGLRTFQTYHLMNGPIECRYSGYQIYSGSLKAEAADQ